MALFTFCLLHAVLQRILGVDVRWHHIDRIPIQRHVLVSNHLTAGDLMMLYSLPHHYVHLISAKLPKRISQVCKWYICRAYLQCIVLLTVELKHGTRHNEQDSGVTAGQAS